MDPATQWTLLARLLRPQGRRGEVLADLYTDFPERFSEHAGVWLAPAGFSEGLQAIGARGKIGETTSPPREAEVAEHWLPSGRNAGRIVLRFAGVDSITQAEALAGLEVVVPSTERLPLESGAAYISDLIGATVYNFGEPIGEVEDVEFPTSPDGLRRLEEAAPLLSVAGPEGEELLIPFAEAYLVELDLPGRAIRMELPEGLTEINKAASQQVSKPASQQD